MKLYRLLFFIPLLTLAQAPNRLIYVSTDPSGSCNNSAAIQWNPTSGNEFGCVSGTWTKLNSSGGGGGITSVFGNLGPVVGATGDIGATGKVLGVNGVPLCTGFTPTTGQNLQYTTVLSPNPCYTAAAPVSGGPSITSGPFVSLPGTCTHTSTQSDVYYFTDSWWINAVCTATNTFSYWGQYGAGAPAGKVSDWTGVNTGANWTATDSAGSIYIKITTNSSLNWRLLTKVVPATPYTIDIFWRSYEAVVSAQNTGVYFYDGTKLMGLEALALSGVYYLRVEKMTNVTTDGSTAASLNGGSSVNLMGPWAGGLCGRLSNDGATLTFAYSMDCRIFSTLFSEAVGTFITPTKFGFGGLSQAAGPYVELWVPSVYVH